MRIPATEKALETFTSMGCYPIVYYCADGEGVCADCANNRGMGDHYHVGCQADITRKGCLDSDPESCLVACDVYWEGRALECAGCNVEIESAYGDPDEGMGADD